MKPNTIIGHDDIQNSLLSLLRTERLPHALLFHGPKGVGKRHVADVLARILIAGQQGDGFIYQTDNPAYKQLEAGMSPSLFVLEKEKTVIKVEQVREVLSMLTLKDENRRVVIVDAAEDLNTSSMNAILKNLEEPGENIHFILVSHNISKLLPTIISRCRQFRFAPLNNKQTKQVLQNEGVEPTEELLTLSKGCPGQAIEHGTSAVDILAQLKNFLEQGKVVSSDITQWAEQCARDKKTEIALTTFKTEIARQAKQAKQPEKALALTKAYNNIEQATQNVAKLNITPQLALETSLAHVISSINGN